MTRKLNNIGQSGPFFELDERRRKAVILLFEDKLTDEEIAKNVQRRRSTLSNWKKDPKFKAAQEHYKQLIVKDKYESKALKRLIELIDAKSEMVQLQAVTTILKMAGRLSENSTPELDEAKVRKAKAEADIAEFKAQTLINSGAEGVDLISKYLDKLDNVSSKELMKDES